MQELEKVTGIVLRTHASGDSDLVLRILTVEEGKISALAKLTRSTRKTSAPSVDVFDCGQFELRRGRGSLRLVKGFVPKAPMHHLRESLDVLTLASVACEVTDFLHLEDGGPQRICFEALMTCLKDLSSRVGMRENCAVLFRGVADLLSDAGFLDSSSVGRGSRDALIALLTQVERATERSLNSKPALIDIVKRL